MRSRAKPQLQRRETANRRRLHGPDGASQLWPWTARLFAGSCGTNALRHASFVLAAIVLGCLVIGAIPSAAQVERDRAVFAAISLGPGPSSAEYWSKRLRWKESIEKRNTYSLFRATCQPRVWEGSASDIPNYTGPPARTFMEWCNGNVRGIALFVFDGEAQAKAYAASQGINPNNGFSWRHAGGPYAIRVLTVALPRQSVEGLLDAMVAEIHASIDLSQTARPPQGASTPSPSAPTLQPPRDPTQSGKSQTPAADEEIPGWPVGEEMPLGLTPAEIAAVSALAGGTALLGSLLMLGASGVRRDEVLQAIRDLLRGRLPEDPYEAWKRKYEALGWKYSEKNGVGTFDPVDGARNEGGEVYSSERGGFVGPAAETTIVPPRLPRDGDVNERGEVWSSFSGGYVERKTYEQDMASRATLAEKDRSDLADMQRPDEDVAELQRQIAATRRKGAEMRTYFKARDELLGALGDQRGREGVDALLDESRSGLFDELSDRLLTTPADHDYRKGLEGLLPLADVIGNQMRPGYTPTYTYRDAAQDTLLQSGAAALDAILTKGWASSAVGSSLAMRDAARAGGGIADIATAGVKAAVTDVLFGKAIHYGAGYAGEAWRAGKNAVAGVAESATDLLAQASRRSQVATDLVEKMRKNLGTLDQGVHYDGSGRLRASLTDVLEVQKNPHQVRALKQSGSLPTQEAFNNTLRNEVYKPHDQMLLERLRQSSPELADKKLVVHDFRTPGKTANPINTDRDFRVLTQNADGKWVEVPKTKWEQHSNDALRGADLLRQDKMS